MNSQWQRVLAGAIVGYATGISAVLRYTNGLFVADLTREFGRTRSAFGLGVQASPVTLLQPRKFRPHLRLAARGVHFFFGPRAHVGAARDTAGTYTRVQIASSVGLVATCIGFLLLPRYPPIVREEN